MAAVTRAMLSKSLTQFSVDGRGYIPSPLFDLRPNYSVGNKDNGDVLQQVSCTHCYTQCPQPCSQPSLTHASAGDSGHSWASLGQSLVGSLLFSPGSWCTQGSVCACQEFVSQSCVRSGNSMMGLMATSSKRAYTIPKPAAPRAPVSVAIHC